jgi:hypothetical protein
MKPFEELQAGGGPPINVGRKSCSQTALRGMFAVKNA